MKLTIEPTDQLYVIDGLKTRRWKGTDEHGHPFDVFVAVIGTAEVGAQFNAEMELLRVKPHEVRWISPAPALGEDDAT